MIDWSHAGEASQSFGRQRIVGNQGWRVASRVARIDIEISA